VVHRSRRYPERRFCEALGVRPEVLAPNEKAEAAEPEEEDHPRDEGAWTREASAHNPLRPSAALRAHSSSELSATSVISCGKRAPLKCWAMTASMTPALSSISRFPAPRPNGGIATS